MIEARNVELPVLDVGLSALDWLELCVLFVNDTSTVLDTCMFVSIGSLMVVQKDTDRWWGGLRIQFDILAEFPH